MLLRLITLSLVLALVACGTGATLSPTDKGAITMPDLPRLKALPVDAPIAKRELVTRNFHGLTLTDPYFWLKDPGYPEVDDQAVLDYLKAENDYYYAWLAGHEALKDTLFAEFKARLEETETSVPWQRDGYEYRWEFREGDDYRTWLWRKLDGGAEEVLLSEPQLAAGHDYFVLGGWAISPDHQLLAYTLDTAGDERYQLYLLDLATGEVTTTLHNNIGDDVTFSADGKSLVYEQLNPERWHTDSINVHVLGSDISHDRVLFAEQDDGYFLSFGVTSDREFLTLVTSQREVNEVWVLSLADLKGEPGLLHSRERGFATQVDHTAGQFYILASDLHKNRRLAKVADQVLDYDQWQTVIAGSDDTYLRGLHTFADRVVLQERDRGIDQVRILPLAGEPYRIEFPESVYRVSLGNNPEFTQSHLRLNYGSMVTPDTVFDYDFASRELITRKVDQVPSGYDPTQYVSERLMAPARDGAEVPVTIVYRRDFVADGTRPLSLYGYGAYGAGMSPDFSTMRLSLLDRGFAYAIAHVRGGDEMGFQWYLDGKLDKRTNTFNDFVDVARFLVAEGYTSAGNISASGRSAGGELMGAVVIQAPELWRSVILGVPFVDVLNTMLDTSLPLTPPEWAEWGNPLASQADFELLQSYSPYDNIEAREYPPMMVTGGLNDPRVTYWEPAKWTAKMRATKTDDNLLLMRINMGAGHFSNSGRYGRLKDYAEEYAFQLLAHGIDE